MGNVTELTDADFQNEVLESDVPVLVDFWAPWCGPCRQIAPLIEELAADNKGSVKVVKVNIDESFNVSQRYGIMSIPTLMIFKGGEVVEKIVEADLKRLCNRRSIPSKAERTGNCSMSSSIKVTTTYYPESDGRPMGETDLHRDAMVRHIELLKFHFRGQEAYVSGDLLVYYEQGNPKKFIVPDAFVAKGVKSHKRRIYKIWEEGKAPDVAIETTSKKSKKKDTVTKPEIYSQIGVKEYFLFDPTHDYLDPPLQGHRMRDNGDYGLIEPDIKGALMSEQLQLRLSVVEDELEFFTVDGKRLLTAEERTVQANKISEAEVKARRVAEAQTALEVKARKAAEAQTALEAEARKAAEAELARLREQLRNQ